MCGTVVWLVNASTSYKKTYHTFEWQLWFRVQDFNKFISVSTVLV